MEKPGSGARFAERGGGRVEAGVLEGLGGLVGHGPGEGDLALVEGDDVGGHKLHEADRLALGDEGDHRQDAVSLVAQDDDLGRIGGRILRVDDDRCLGFEDAARLGIVG